MSRNNKSWQKNKRNTDNKNVNKEKNKNNPDRNNKNEKRNTEINNAKKKFEFKKIEFPAPICPRCGTPIKDIVSAVSDKATGTPVHFDCIVDFLKKSETLKESEEIIYIGAGNFAVVYFENPKIRKNFKIIKLIEWENKNGNYEWKTGIANLASKV